MKKKKAEGPKGLPGWMASYADMVTVLMTFFILMFALSQVDEELWEAFLSSWNPNRAVAATIFLGEGGGLLTDFGDGILPDQPPPPEPITGDGEEEGDAETSVGGEEDEGGLGGIETEGDTVGDMLNTFRTYMAPYELLQQGQEAMFTFDVDEGNNFLRITLPAGQDGLLFNSGQIDLLPGAVEALRILGPILEEFAMEGRGIIVEGHTDNIPVNIANPFRTNTILSSGRAASVVDFLKANWNIHPDLIIPVGRGEDFPVADNGTVEGRAQNRRVEIKVFTSDVTGGAIGSWWMIPRD
jgi:chemotaxis protein MotB